MSRTVLRTTAGMSTYSFVEISPATMTMPVVTSVSHATRPGGSTAMIASRTASEIWSASLSGCPSVTDSEVKRCPLAISAGSIARPSVSGERTRPSSAVEELHDPVADLPGEGALGPGRQRRVVAVGREDQCLVRVGAEPRSGPTDLADHDQVEPLRLELLPACAFEVGRLGGESHHDAALERVGELREDVGRRLEANL